ncbi:MAG TPA: SurA N-terminal domain-containing protein [Woeseiaceae bacterium]
MLQKLRERFTGKLAIAIFALLLVPFAFFGVQQGSLVRGGYALKVDGLEIPPERVQQAFQETLARYAQQGNDIPPEMYGLVRQAVVADIVRDALVSQHLARENYQVTDAMIADLIRQVPQFQENGKFSKQLYYDWLASQSLAPRQFEEGRRQALRESQLQRGVAATAFVTPAEYRRYLNLYGEQRRAAVATFDTAAAAEQVEVEDEQVAGYYDAHPDEFQAEESADIAWIEIDRRDLAAKVELTDEQVEQYYSQVSDRYQQDEQRKARHILVAFGDDKEAAREEATAVAERARAGEPFEDLAREHSDDTGTAEQGGDLGLVLKSQMPGPLGDAIFAAQKGEIVGPVESEFGFHIVRVDDVQPGGPLPLADVRGEIERELRDDKAGRAFNALERRMSDALFEAKSLDDMAKALGLEVQTADGFTRSGGEPLGNNQAAIDAVFDPAVLNEGRISEIVDLDANRAAVFAVREHHPAELKPLGEVKEQIAERLRNERAREIVRERAEELAAALEGGADFAEAAQAAGAEVTGPALLRRQDDKVDARVLEAIFRAPKPAAEGKPSIGTAVTGSGDQAVFSVAAVQPGRPEAIPLEQRDARKLELAAEAGRADYAALLLDLERNAEIVRSEEALQEPAF